MEIGSRVRESIESRRTPHTRGGMETRSVVSQAQIGVHGSCVTLALLLAPLLV